MMDALQLVQFAAWPNGIPLEPVIMSEENYEYLDHTADIQVHAWGTGLEKAFENTAHAMVNYMYERSSIDETFGREIEVEEEVLYIFSCDPYMAVKTVQIEPITKDEITGNYFLKAHCRGEEYERHKHGSKTEIKAVTFSNMRINTNTEDNRVDIYIIFDI